jgi:hypothetical protein
LVSGDPGTGNLRTNNILPLSVTSIGISVTDTNGASQRPLLETMATGDSLYLCNPGCTNAKLYEITSTPTDNTTWFFFTVNFLSQSDVANYAAAEVITVDFINAVNTLQQAYQASIAPQITVDDFLGPLEIKNDQTLMTDKTLDILDNTDTSVFSVDGLGNVNVLAGEISNFTYSTTPSTGWYGTPPSLSINGGDNTKFDVTAGSFIHIDNTTNPPTITRVVMPARTAQTPTFIATETASFISCDVSGNLVQRNANNTPQQRRETGYIGLVSHVDNLVIDDTVTHPQVILNPLSQAHDVIESLGFRSLSGNAISPLGLLTLQKDAGTGFKLNENSQVNILDPHNFTMAALSPIVLNQITQNLSTFIVSATIDPTSYDNAGTLTTIPAANNAVIHRVYAFANNSIVWMFGQQVYASLSAAKDAVGTESFVETQDIADNGLLLGKWILTKSCLDLTDTSKAFYVPVSTGVNSSGTVVTLQGAYNNSTPDPEILTNTTNGAVTLMRGSDADTDNVLEIKKGDTTVTTSITGNGNVTCTQAYIDQPAGTNIPMRLKDTDRAKGSTIQTITFSDSSNDTTGTIGVNTTEFLISNTNTNGHLTCDLLGTGAIRPQTTNITDLGTSSEKFKDIHINVNGLGTLGNYVVGSGAGAVLKTTGIGNYNILMGSNAGASIDTSNNSTALGTGALRYIDGNCNTGIGTSSVQGDTLGSTATQNVGVGCYTIQDVTTGASNSALGHSALNAVTSGDSNVGIGKNAGNTITDGIRNVCIGADSDMSTGSENYSIALGYEATATDNNQMLIGSDTLANTITSIVPGYTTSPVTDLGSTTAPFATLYNTSQVLDHTATQDDEFAFEIKNNAAGFASKSLEIVHTTGGMVAGDQEDGVLISIDKTLSSGGDFIGVNVLATEGTADCIALESGALVSPLKQLVGSFAVPSVTNLVMSWTTDLPWASLGGVDLFPSDNDYIEIHDANQFQEIEFLLAVESKQNLNPTFEYSNGVGTFATFNPTDGTNGFTNTGIVSWMASDVTGWVTDGGVYKIKITRTRDNITTEPQVTANGIKVADVTEYGWDSAGDITCNDINCDRINVTTRSHGECYGSDDGTTTISVQGTAVKINVATTSKDLSDFTHANNKLSYSGTATKKFMVSINWTGQNASGSAIVDSGLHVAKNGTVVTGSGSYAHTNYQTPYYMLSMNSIVELATNDYIEGFVSNETDTNDFDKNWSFQMTAIEI